MNFLNQLLRGMAFIPALVSGIEGLFGSKSGAEKKDAAMSFLENALATVDAVAAREIIDPDKFKDGISKIIDGTVECLNARPGRRAALNQQQPLRRLLKGSTMIESPHPFGKLRASSVTKNATRVGHPLSSVIRLLRSRFPDSFLLAP